MTQAPTPTVDTVRRLARSLLKDSGHGAGASAALDVRPAGDGGLEELFLSLTAPSKDPGGPERERPEEREEDAS